MLYMSLQKGNYPIKNKFIAIKKLNSNPEICNFQLEVRKLFLCKIYLQLLNDKLNKNVKNLILVETCMMI